MRQLSNRMTPLPPGFRFRPWLGSVAILAVLLLSLALRPAAAELADHPLIAEGRAAMQAGNAATAIAAFEQAYAQGVPDGAEMLGSLFLRGVGSVKADYAKARDWSEKAAAAGSAGAFLNLGLIWRDGLGIQPDPDKALGFFERADAAGQMKAARYIGLYHAGKGEEAEAVRWWQKGAAAGDITSQYYLGRAYHTGVGIAQDFALAREWYRKAALRGDIVASDGMMGLGSLYEAGQGVAQDLLTARAYYTEAASLGNEAAKAALTALAARIGNTD